MENKKTQKKKSKYRIWVILTAALILVLNLLFLSTDAANFYRRHIFGIWSETYGRVTGLFPFSVGGIMIVAAILLVAGMMLSLLLLPFLKKKQGYGAYVKIYGKTVLAVILTALFLYTLNCTALFHCSKMAKGEKEYSLEELEILRNYLIAQCKECGTFEKDESGSSVYGGENLQQDVKDALRGISDLFPELAGYYPNAKYFLDSDIMYYAEIIGMYYPFSMEAHVSKYLSDTCLPNTMAHEMAHLKGFLFEDEANFIAYLACTGSKNPFIRYSGYLGVLGYVENDYYTALCTTYGEQYVKEHYVPLSQQIENYRADSRCYKLSPEYQALQGKTQSVAAKVYNAVEDNLMDAAYDFYGNEVNYEEVTGLLLEYYDGILY